MTSSPPIRVGTRASPLARWQAQWVAAELAARGAAVELVAITTQGDVRRDVPIGGLGAVGVFTKELQRALLDGRIDVAVHSLKDLPTDAVPGLALAAVPPRESPRDALIGGDGKRLADLPIGASSGRAACGGRPNCCIGGPDLQIAPIRGNVETRLDKVSAGEFAAIVLAEAGLKRLSLTNHVTEFLEPPDFLPAVGQGALGLETRDDGPARAVVAALDDPASHAAVDAERAFLAALAGGCLAPIGAGAARPHRTDWNWTAWCLIPKGGNGWQRMSTVVGARRPSWEHGSPPRCWPKEQAPLSAEARGV